MSGSPYKKPQSSTSQLAKNRLASVTNPAHTSEEVERLKVRKPSFPVVRRCACRFARFTVICVNIDSRPLRRIVNEALLRLQPSYSTEELNQEMANLEGLMKDLNAITASEFEC